VIQAVITDADLSVRIALSYWEAAVFLVHESRRASSSTMNSSTEVGTVEPNSGSLGFVGGPSAASDLGYC